VNARPRSHVEIGVKAASVTAVVFLSMSCASGPKAADPAQAAPYVGCYKLTLGPWLPNVDLGGDEDFVEMPGAIRLTDEIGREGRPRGRFLLRNVPGYGGGRISPSYWRLEGKNELVLIWTDGATAIMAELTGVKAGLRGRAEVHWDFPREVQRRDVTATPMPCPTP
jgi:hypothetical protein